MPKNNIDEIVKAVEQYKSGERLQRVNQSKPTGLETLLLCYFGWTAQMPYDIMYGNGRKLCAKRRIIYHTGDFCCLSSIKMLSLECNKGADCYGRSRNYASDEKKSGYAGAEQCSTLKLRGVMTRC